jgi:hypothetical protein
MIGNDRARTPNDRARIPAPTLELAVPDHSTRAPILTSAKNASPNTSLTARGER